MQGDGQLTQKAPACMAPACTAPAGASEAMWVARPSGRKRGVETGGNTSQQSSFLPWRQHSWPTSGMNYSIKNHLASYS